jgi:MFS family permease
MHFENVNPSVPTNGADAGPWHRGLTRYHWFVLIVAALGWLFDTMDQQLFNLARRPALTELVTANFTLPADSKGNPEAEAAFKVELNKRITDATGAATAIFMIGWALGGLAFGVLGDKIGRAKTMLLTILVYSIFTGLSALSRGVWDFCLYRFITGLGVGGEFAVGVALVAEVMPDRARPFALGWLQALSAGGNMIAALIAIGLGLLEGSKLVSAATFSSWRIMFVIGTLPALLAILIRARLKEPERWQKAASTSDASMDAAKLGSLTELFTDPRWRRNTIVGMLLAFSGVVGLWGIGFFSFDLIRLIFRKDFEGQGLSQSVIDGRLTLLVGLTSLVQNGGAFFGVHAFSRVTHYTGRRPAFAITFILALVSTAFTFWFLGRTPLRSWDVFWMIPIMGFCQIALFGGYAIYFPELFPTRLRSTGTSFCYNVGRLVAAVGPFVLTSLTSGVFSSYATYGADWPMRYAGVTMCSFFLIGLFVLPFAPETKGKPLPE